MKIGESKQIFYSIQAFMVRVVQYHDSLVIQKTFALGKVGYFSPKHFKTLMNTRSLADILYIIIVKGFVASKYEREFEYHAS